MASEYLPIGCYGKLPFHPEYLDVRGGYPTSRALREWLHEGRAAAGSSENEDEEPRRQDIELRARLRLLIGLPGSPELLAAVLRPSSGRGDREFPFAVFTHFPRRPFSRHYAMLPLALAPVWNELDAVWDSLASVASKAAFEEIRESLRVPDPAPPRKEVTSHYASRLGEPAAALFRRAGGPGLRELEAQLQQVVSRLGSKKNHEPLIAELPVSTDLDAACFDASFWIDLFNKQFFMKRFEPCVVIHADRGAENRQVLLKFGPLGPADYASCARLRGAGAEVSRPASPDGGERSVGGEGPESGPVELSYGEFAKRRFTTAG